MSLTNRFSNQSINVLMASVITLTGLVSVKAHAAAFNSGSIGTEAKVISVDAPAIDLPSDGILHYQSLTVEAGAVMRFNKNEDNTPVFILTQGDILINGTIDVSGQDGGEGQIGIGGVGGPGGFGGGRAGVLNSPGSEPSAGFGPGANPNVSTSATFVSTYGNPQLLPMIGGSGGSGGDANYGAGGGGGGAILLASSTNILVNGSILARGGNRENNVGINFQRGLGSGGAIRLVAPNVDGLGSLDVRRKGVQNSINGRVRIDSFIFPNTTLNLNCVGSAFPSASCTRGSFMKVFLDVTPKLDIVSVAGNEILPLPDGTRFFQLDFGSDAVQPVVILPTNFQNDITVRVQLTPVSGPATFEDFNVEINNPVTHTLNVTFPVNVVVNINAWTL